MTSVLIFCNFRCQFQVLYGFRNLSSGERYGFVGREGSASNSFHLALAMAMAAFTVFQVLSVTYSCQVKGIAFARKMHSTTKFAMTVLSKCVWNISKDVKLVPDKICFDLLKSPLRGCQGCTLDCHQRRGQCVICDIDGDDHRRTCTTCQLRDGKRLNPRTSLLSFLHFAMFWTWFVNIWMMNSF